MPEKIRFLRIAFTALLLAGMSFAILAAFLPSFIAVPLGLALFGFFALELQERVYEYED